MIEIHKNIFIGDDNDCSLSTGSCSIIHACKTCHQIAIGYRGNLSPSHPNYLIYENENHLFLNIVDMDRELLAKYTHPILESALAFIAKHIQTKKVLIHCNQGHSRSPSIGLVYLAKNNIISNDSFQIARENLLNIYPAYLPGKGLELYLEKHWDDILIL